MTIYVVKPETLVLYSSYNLWKVSTSVDYGIMRTEDTTDRLHLSLLNRQKDVCEPNTGSYTFDERALGKGSWVCIINTGYDWEKFPSVSTRLPALSFVTLFL